MPPSVQSDSTIFPFSCQTPLPLKNLIAVKICAQELLQIALTLVSNFLFSCLETVHVITLVILSRGKCGLSRCVTHYLMAMSATDLLFVILDLIMRRVPIIFSSLFWFVLRLKVCNIHAVLLYAVTDCSVWFTVAFTFDRYVAICCPKLKPKYCTEKKAAVIIAVVAVICCLKNIFWYFILGNGYHLLPYTWFCYITNQAFYIPLWSTIQSLHHILTPGLPFFLILLINSLTVRYILVANRARRRIRSPSGAGGQKDSELGSWKNSNVLLFAMSGNFILLWVVFTVNSIYVRIAVGNFLVSWASHYAEQFGFMLQINQMSGRAKEFPALDTSCPM